MDELPARTGVEEGLFTTHVTSKMIEKPLVISGCINITNAFQVRCLLSDQPDDVVVPVRLGQRPHLIAEADGDVGDQVRSSRASMMKWSSPVPIKNPVASSLTS